MNSFIIRSVIFTVQEGRVTKVFKKAVAEFLGSEENEEEFSRLAHISERKAALYVQSIAPPGQLIQFYKTPSSLDGSGEGCILAQVSSTETVML